MTREEARRKYDTRWWLTATPENIVGFQLFEPALCMDFAAFMEALDKVLGRTVMVQELTRPDLLQKEFRKEKPQPTLEETLAWSAQDKRVLILRK